MRRRRSLGAGRAGAALAVRARGGTALREGAESAWAAVCRCG